jgi:hypothetical protein
MAAQLAASQEELSSISEWESLFNAARIYAYMSKTSNYSAWNRCGSKRLRPNLRHYLPTGTEEKHEKPVRTVGYLDRGSNRVLSEWKLEALQLESIGLLIHVTKECITAFSSRPTAPSLIQPNAIHLCLRSLGSRDRGFESHSGHGCLVFVYVCVFCVCVQVEALRWANHPSKESYRLSLIKKLRKQPYAPKREQVPKVWEQSTHTSMYRSVKLKVVSVLN